MSRSRYYVLTASGRRKFKVERRNDIRNTATGMSFTLGSVRYFKTLGTALAAADRGNANLMLAGNLYGPKS